MEVINLKKRHKRNEFGRALSFSFFGIFLFYNILMQALKHFTDYKFSIDQPTVFFSLLISGYFSYLSTRSHFNFWPIYRIFTISVYLLVTYLGLVTVQRSMIPCLFYVPILLMVLTQTSLKKTVALSLVTLLICFFLRPISEGLHLSQPTTLSAKGVTTLKYLMYVIQLIATYLSLLVIYYYNALNKIEQIIEIKKNAPDSPETNYKVVERVSSATGIELLYEKIVEYMEDKQPYTNPDFSIQMLSQKLSSNPTYVSRALNQKGGQSFTQLVQQYRIEMVEKEMLQSTDMKIEQIYKKAGFSQQTTFNRKFKEITGKTPSQYMDELRLKSV